MEPEGQPGPPPLCLHCDSLLTLELFSRSLFG